MSRTFAYARVSTAGQTAANQLREIEAAGFEIPAYRTITETVSGSVAARERPQFARLLDRLEPGDMLVVTKLDRLGRNAMDVSATVTALAEISVRVHCLALGGADLSSPAGTFTVSVLNSVAQLERDLLIERTQAGQARARADGKSIGRPPAVSAETRQEIIGELAAGATVSSLARRYGVGRATITRLRDAAEGSAISIPTSP